VIDGHGGETPEHSLFGDFCDYLQISSTFPSASIICIHSFESMNLIWWITTPDPPFMAHSWSDEDPELLPRLPLLSLFLFGHEEAANSQRFLISTK
jgi:hypothetical protein